MPFTPPYPKPLTRTGGRTFYRLKAFLEARRCSIASLLDRSYSMRMGEIWMPFRRFFMVCEPSLIEQVLIADADKFPKSLIVEEMLGILMKDSIIATNGELWQRQRRMMNPAFEQARIKVVFDLMRGAVDDSIARIDRRLAEPEQAIDLELTHVTADIIFRTIFSRPLTGDESETMFRAFTVFQEMAFAHGMLRTAGLPKFFTLPRQWKARRAARVIRGILDPLVKARYDSHMRGEGKGEQDILASMIAIADPETGQRFSLDELCSQVVMLFLAGHETSAASLAFTLYLIAMEPAAQERMSQESIAVLADRPAQFTDMKRLDFIRDVFREALRLYPPMAFMPREAACPMQMRDKDIKPGDIVNVSPWLMHRHRRFWKEPDVFDPGRFADPASVESQRCAYLPFSQGRRVCLGAAFAMQESTLILAMLLRRYRFEPVPGFVPKPVGRLTVRSENGIRLRVMRRA